MRIMVTGGCGFIGSNFIEYVLENTDARIVNIDSITYAGKNHSLVDPRYTLYPIGIGSDHIYHLLLAHRITHIINFAAESHVDRSIQAPDNFVKTNIDGTYSFIKSVHKYFLRSPSVRFVHVSTDEVFGSLTELEPPFTEQSPYRPNSPYSATKAASDHLVRAWHETYGLPAIITNCSNNYGPRQFPEKFVPVVIDKASRNDYVPVYGDGKNIRDWIYVRDHCEALYMVLTHGVLGDSYNIGGNMELSNIAVVNTILDIMGASSDLINFVPDRLGHDFRYAIDSTHIKNVLGWTPKTKFSDGIEKTIQWYADNKQWTEKCKSLV